MFKQLKRINYFIFVCLFFIIQQSYVEAVEFLPLDNIAISTGGAGVASASSSFGSYYNPALLAHRQWGFEWVTSVGVGIREFNLAEPIDALADVDISDTLDELSNTDLNSLINTTDLIAFAASNEQQTELSTVNLPESFKKNARIIDNELHSIAENNGLQIMPNVSLGFQIGNFGIGLFSISELTAVASIDRSRLEIMVESTINTGTVSHPLPVTVPTDYYLNYKPQQDKLALIKKDVTTSTATYESSSLEYAVNEGLTHLKLKGITYYEAPVSYAHKFNTPLGHLSLGGSVKFMLGYTYEKEINIDTETGEIQDEFDDGSEHQDTTFGFDAGFLFAPKIFNNRLVAGMVMKNINSPKFETKSGSEFTIDPQIRAGMLYHIWWDTLMISMDYDFTENESLLDNYTSQMIGGGIHFKPFHALSLRCGAQQNMKSDDYTDEGTIYTAGLSLGLKWLKLDISGQYSTETTEFDGTEIPSSARAQVSLVSNLFYRKRKPSDTQAPDLDQRDVVQDAAAPDEDEESEDLQEEIEPDLEEMPEESEEIQSDTESAIPVPISPTIDATEELSETPESSSITTGIAEPSEMTETISPEPEAPQAPPCPTNNIEAKMQETVNIITALNEWANYWSSMNIDAYLGMYAPNFEPANGKSRASWEESRRKRLSKDSIKVNISNVSIDFTGCSSAKASFDQDYASPGYKDHTQKIILLEKQDDQWLIRQERTVE